MMNNQKVKHIGIVACSYEGAALCYKAICNEGALYLGEHAHPEVSLHTYPLNKYMKHIVADDWEGVAALMISSANKLSTIGAEILICPDNTIHQAFSSVKNAIALPWLHIAEEVTKEAGKNNYRKIGILGTKYLMEGPVYPQKFTAANIRYQTPTEEKRKQVNNIIFNELVYGIIKKESKEYLLSIVTDFKSEGCDAVVLGCTELPLIILQNESPLPTLDSTRILARAALKNAITA